MYASFTGEMFRLDAFGYLDFKLMTVLHYQCLQIVVGRFLQIITF